MIALAGFPLNPPDDSPVFEMADAVQQAMETRPAGHGWTPSEVARRTWYGEGDQRRRLDSAEARQVMEWMVRRVFLASDDRGAWTHYYLRH